MRNNVENGGKNMDLSRQLKNAIATGKLLFGQRQAIDACANGDAKFLDVAPLKDAGASDVSFLDNKKYVDSFLRSSAIDKSEFPR